MKKSVIALAVASAFAAPAALAEVTISGAINIGIAMVDSDDSVPTPATPNGLSKTGVATNYSNMNITSVDDIGGGTKVVANIQLDLGSMNNTGAIGNRNSYLGIEGGWGSFRMGTNENVYERWNYESDPLDGAMGIGGNIQMLGNTGFQGGGWFDVGNGQTGDNGSFWRRTHHTIWYNSPNWSGFTFEVDQTLSAFKTNTAGTELDPTITSIGAQFKPEGGKFFVNVGFEQHKDQATGAALSAANLLNTAGAHDADAMSVGGGFAFGPVLITARFEQLSWEAQTGGGKLDRDHIWAGVKWTLPGGYFGAEVGSASDADNAAGAITSSGATMIGLGYFHNLSKQSQAYVIGTQISNDDAANYGIGAGPGSTGGLGSDHMAISVGMKHTF